MRKMFAVVVLVSAAAAGCHGKKPAPTPPVEKVSPETGGTGGAAYGGQSTKPTDAPPASKDAPKPEK